MIQDLEKPSADPGLSLFERRKGYRLSIRMPVTISGFHPQTLENFCEQTFTVNVSRDGACFQLRRGQTKVGSILDLNYGKKFDSKCRVVWVKEGDDSRMEVGVEFMSVNGQWVLYN